MAVAAIGFMMLTGRMNWRYGATVILGCFILFGATIGNILMLQPLIVADRFGVPPAHQEYWLRRIWLTEEEEQGYYYGFANEGMWPLCHVAHNRPLFRSADWAHYQAVNKRFADAVCAEVEHGEGANTVTHSRKNIR